VNNGEGGKMGIATRQGRRRKELKGWPILIIACLTIWRLTSTIWVVPHS